ncbi:MAG: MBL fold metallo-hydrolase [Chloroflexi bacterium]|nr:MBL fold metallo-hydrolase [Chloroflexota bacterium]
MTTVYEGSLWSIQSFVSGFQNNAYLLTCRRTGSSVVIDTPDQPAELIRAAARTSVQGVLITHNHLDHLQGFNDVMSNAQAPVGIGAADASAISGKLHGTLDVSHGNLLSFGDITLRCIATPGHTPGSTCFMLPSEQPGATPHVFTGDTLFPGGPGKSGSPQAFRQLVASIETDLLTLPEITVVLPGHGTSTTVKESRAEFDLFSRSQRRDDLYGDVTWTGDNR